MMRYYLGASLLLAFVLPASAAKPKPKPKPKPTTPAAAPLDGSKLGYAHYTGKVMSLPDAERNFVIRITYQQIQLKDPKAIRRNNPQVQHLQRMQQQLVRLEQQMRRSRNPLAQLQRIQQLAAQIQQQQARYELSLYKVANVSKDIQFQAAEDMKVRLKKPPADFDDKGNIKKYTAAELKELKGPNPSLPGYQADLPDLKVGQTVQVSLGRHKTAPKTGTTKPAGSPDDSPGKEDKEDKDPIKEKKVQARMILIVTADGDDSSRSSPGKKPPRRKKK